MLEQRTSPCPGALPQAGGTTFTVWASGARSVSVLIDSREHLDLEPGRDGYFSGHFAGVGAGTRYMLCVDGSQPLPDPASRWQPDGAQGASEIVDGETFAWTDQGWPGVGALDQILYEMHIGTFTPEGTWKAAEQKLSLLKDVGVSVLQIMPIGEFEGRFGWGYDPVQHFAPFHPYGKPDDLRHFIDTAHRLGLGVILDVVYNHVGVGNHFAAFSPDYFADQHGSEWGDSFEFNALRSRGARDFVIANAVYWITDFHFDGLRLDATQALVDDSPEHLIAEITRCARAAAGKKALYIVAENQPQDRQLITVPAEGGYGLDAIGNDDFHHSARVALTGHSDFYYRDYAGSAQELVSAAKYGFLYHGQRSDMRNAAYGTDNLDTGPQHIITFLENHDQIANSARGLRLTALGAPARIRALTTLFLLAPQTPMLFQGQEFAASGSFYYFAGVDADKAPAFTEGRRRSLSNFPSVLDPKMQARLPLPDSNDTFIASKLNWTERDSHASTVAFHHDLIAIRRTTRAFSQSSGSRIDGAVLSNGAFLLRWFTDDIDEQRLLLVNIGPDHNMAVVAEPLLAPPAARRWDIIWSSEDPDYGGLGQRPMDMRQFWVLPANTAIFVKPVASQSAGR